MNKLKSIIFAFSLLIIPVATITALAPPASAACNLHVVYWFYLPKTNTALYTTDYSIYAKAKAQGLRTGYGWYC